MRARTKRRIVAAAALLAALTALAWPRLTADDPLSKPEYEARVRAAYAPVQAAFAATAGRRGDELPALIDEAGEAVEGAAADLEDAEPPKEVAALHDALVAGLNDLAEELAVVADTARRSGSARAVETYNETIADNRSITQIAEAAETMKFMGYDLGRIAEE